MRLCLISPKDTFLKNAGDRPPLGIAYLASYAKMYVEGLDVVLVDMNHTNEIPKGFEYYGVSSVTPNYVEVMGILERIQKENPSAKTIVGGPHASAVPETMKGFDFVVIGEGEQALVSILKGEANEGFIHVKPIEDLDELPLPARELLPMDKYTLSLEGKPCTPLITSRGCPFNCVYCGKQVTGKKWRAHSAEHVIYEIAHIMRAYGINNFMIYDDTFTVDKKRLKSLLKLKEDFGLDFYFRCTTRADLFDEETAKLLKALGCKMVCFGIESGNDEILKKVGKGMTKEQNRKAVELAKKYGMRVRGYFMLGLPFDTPKTVQETIDFAKELNIKDTEFYVLTPYPSTEIWSNPKKFDLVIENDVSWFYTQAVSDGLPPIKYESKHISKECLINFFKEAKKRGFDG